MEKRARQNQNLYNQIFGQELRRSLAKGSIPGSRRALILGPGKSARFSIQKAAEDIASRVNETILPLKKPSFSRLCRRPVR